jgi:hypothetical protein
MAQELIRKVDPKIHIRWLNGLEEPEEVAKRGGFAVCVVNGRAIHVYVLEKENFKRGVTLALHSRRG